MADYDVVVIGAGNGGLTAAAHLARKGIKVLVLERHNIPGGCATSFCRGRFEFEVALHQLSGLGSPEYPGPLRALLDRLGVMDKLEFVPMTDLYRITVADRIDITLRPEWNETIATLQQHFPKEKEAIKNFFDFVKAYFMEVISAFYMNDPDTSREKYPRFFKYALRNTQEVLDEYFKDPMLKFVISPYWGYMGLPPRYLAFNDMAALLFGYMEFKPYHLKGGSQAMSNAIADAVLTAGSTIQYNCGAKKIIVKDGAVRGVITEDGDEISTGFVISNASKISTYMELIDREHVPESVIGEFRQSTISQSGFCLYLGMDATPEELDIPESTHFIGYRTDVDRAYEKMKVVDISDDDFIMMTCYDLIMPDFSPPGTCQITLVTLKYGDAWLRVPPARYAETKFMMGERMLSLAERAYPKLRSHIEEMEISTPLTHLRYLGHPWGAIYGFDHFAKDSNIFVPPVSHIKGLYGAGAWMGYPGFQPTLESGVAAGRAVIREMKG